jgi:hypothetical protein
VEADRLGDHWLPPAQSATYGWSSRQWPGNAPLHPRNGRPVDPAALALSRSRLELDDISAFVHMFRARGASWSVAACDLNISTTKAGRAYQSVRIGGGSAGEEADRGVGWTFVMVEWLPDRAQEQLVPLCSACHPCASLGGAETRR